ncbi:MAG: AprI/Inh family metalloprotease inhibitor [Devosia sp.]|uniref:AprI/Inh family metalloprotease inhibitor n=1 Tax=unclassified Devosia TaxID=196773 RepID=UPI0019F04575|nr:MULTISPECIES: AprI/Inh family metalloprotease inhibitor [unclassified Devosia]MBF0677911.1 AprI/Inh family metalloprotease inhibitor [Devosia sp.]WEJ33526.1 AprI/Inh family metalloprotease inhibitor [Devosia sp. SD17-2]
MRSANLNRLFSRRGPVARFAVLAVTVAALAGCETTGDGGFDDRPAPPRPAFQPGVSQETVYGNSGAVTTQTRIDPQTGQRVLTGGSFVIGSAGASSAGFGAPFGTWTLTDDFARRCTISFGTAPLAGSAGAMQLDQNGFCSSDFEEARGWMNAGSGIALTNASGRILGQLSPDGQNGYTGSFNSSFGPRNVKLARG